MEVHLHAGGSGAAPSRLDAGEGFGLAAGTDRTQPGSAGGETVSVEPAVAEPVLFRGAGDGGVRRGAARRGRHGLFPRPARQSGGPADDAADAAQAQGIGTHPENESGGCAADDSGAPAALERDRMSACLVCGSEESTALFRGPDRLFRTTAKEFVVVRCTDCGLARLDPKPSLEEVRRSYPDKYWFAPDGGAAGRLEEVYRRLVLRAHVGFVARAMRGSKARGPLLDVGCGGGLFLGMMRERGFRVVGLDFSREAAATAWRRQQAPAVCGDLARAPFGARSCAGITMFHVLEHLYDPRAYLTAARELLAADGRLVVQVPN